MFVNKVNIGKFYHWKPWLGCKKVSEACKNCYIDYLDKFILLDYDFLPFKEDAKPGSMIITSIVTDFFLEESDPYREKAWNTIKNNPDLIFVLITKRIERVKDCLPKDWGTGYENVVLCVTTENQKRADERIPILKATPAKHKWLTCSPLLEDINILPYLKEGFIEHVECSGEKGNFYEIRELKYEWVESLSKQCKEANVRFSFMQIGHKFNREGHIYSGASTCYCCPSASILNLDNDVPITFNLKSLQKTF